MTWRCHKIKPLKGRFLPAFIWLKGGLNAKMSRIIAFSWKENIP
jgi:hypothetical protein